MVYDEFLEAKATRERGNADTETVKTGTDNANAVDTVTASTRTVNTAVAYPNTAENSNTVPDGMTPETFCFTFTAGSEEALVGIAKHIAGFSYSGKVEVTMRYTTRRLIIG